MKSLICACAVFVVALGAVRAEDKGKSKVDWEQAYRQLLKKHPEIRKKVESGDATKQQILAWLKKRVATKVAKIDWEAVYEKALKEDPGLRKKVESGQATKQDVIAWLKNQGANGGSQTAQKSKPTNLNLKRFGEKLRALAKAGKLSPAEAKRLYALAAGGDGPQGQRTARGKGKGGKKTKAGVTNFYAIVIGRLKSKDIELGEFSMEVDHVTSMYGNRWVKDELVGQVVNVSGVSGKFLDQLLLIKRGETLKFRSGSYIAKSQTLKFGAKFHVLERAKPFDPAAYGVPPEKFRGFTGVLQGTIVETGGYEAMLRVEKVVHTGEGNESQDANCIQGKLVRLTGFFRHQKKYNDLRLGDTIRVGARHANPTHDELGVTSVLEKVK